MYNPKPQTRNEIMWAAMAGRDFDLDEKGRFEMFMSDVAERINEGGGGSFIVPMRIENDDLVTDVQTSEIVEALNAGKIVMIKLVETEEDEEETYEYDTYYIMTEWSIEEGVLTGAEAVTGRPRKTASDYNYYIPYIRYAYNIGWETAQTPCSAQVLRSLSSTSLDSTLASSLIVSKFGYSSPSLSTNEVNEFKAELSDAIDTWKSLATSNAGKQCVYTKSIDLTENPTAATAFSKLSEYFIGSFGFFDASNYESIFGSSAKLRPIEVQGNNVVLHFVLDGPLGIPFDVVARIVKTTTTATIQLIGSLPIDA